jgi:helicase required for RNAi-mediated heterochromatin assembly 1
MTPYRFPLSEHLVCLNKSIGAPKLVEEQPRMNLKSLIPVKGGEEEEYENGLLIEEDEELLENVDVLSSWPKIDMTSLDQSQMSALRRMLTKKLAIVQGPPGTGKTFTSISALTVMLDNLGPSDPPIIVAAQTNHALDQLLTLIAPVEPKFLRLGGRTTEDNELVKARSLYELMTQSGQRGNGGYGGMFRNAKKALEETAGDIKTTIDNAIHQGVDEATYLFECNIITKEQFDSLHNPAWVVAHDPELPPGAVASWLGREQVATPPSCPTMNMGFEEEEQDPEFEALEETEAEKGTKEDDDIDSLHGSWYPFKEKMIGRSTPGCPEKKVKVLLANSPDLHKIPTPIRGEVYRYMRRQLKIKMLAAFRAHLLNYKRDAQNLKVARWESQASMIRKENIRLIGCTTTGLSKYRGLLASLEPRILFIEEAAETLEGTILAAMFDSLQQLILVGDHQQLQASCNISSLLEPPYNLAVSMFERLVNNGLEYTMLNKQRRMITEIRELLNPFYPELQDHQSVLDRVVNRKPVPGMGGRDSYFFHHQWPESRDDALSRYNSDEAEMIAHFYTYLVRNGTEPSKITVLTFYNGQRKMILRQLRRQSELSACVRYFNVFTVDSYQGEENDVVLLSLVRSNNQHSIGFLENKNRAVVSLSRARRGLYIFGNSINLLVANTQSFKLWSSITDQLRSHDRLDIDSGLPIVCTNHHRETIVREPYEWDELAGGCTAKCSGQFPCGHPCPYKCHP